MPRHATVLATMALVLTLAGATVVPAGSAGDAPAGPGVFIPTGSMAQPRTWHTATLLVDGRVLIVGGQGQSDDEGVHVLDTAEVWDPATGMFTPAGSLHEGRAAHTATLLPDGRVLVVGGRGGDSGFTALASAELWNPQTTAFQRAGDLATARTEHSDRGGRLV